MSMKGKKLWNKVVSFVLTMAMVFSVFVVATPEEVKAASMSFKGKGKSSVTISDSDCYDASGYYGYMKANWIKFKASQTGYITIKMSSASEVTNPVGFLTFCDNKKKALGKNREAWSTNYDDSEYYTRTYGVKKGKTYYFRVESNAGVKVSASVTKLNKGKNTSKKKAKTINSGKKVKGVIIAGDKTADWYKIKVNGNQRVKLSYSAKTNGDTDYNGIKVTFYKSNGSLYKSGSYDWVSAMTPSSWSKFYRENKATKQQFGITAGTYYVKVERYNKTSSGQYTLSWKAY